MRSILYYIISKIKKLQNKDIEIDTLIQQLQEENQELYDAMPKTTGTGTDITLNNTAKGKMYIEVSGNTEQDTNITTMTSSPNPDYPQDVRVVTGENTIKITNEDGTEEQSLSLNLGNIELCKIGDYQDYIYKNNGSWYIKKNISKVILNGSENWEGGQTGTVSTDYTYFYTNAIDSLIKTLYYKAFCNKFKNLNADMSISTNVNTDTISVGSSASSRIRIMIKSSRLSSQSPSEFKTWLSTHNTIIYYVLATAQDILITESTLINQLEAIYNTAKSYKTQTHIFTVTEEGNVAPILDVISLLDLNSIINS